MHRSKYYLLLTKKKKSNLTFQPSNKLKCLAQDEIKNWMKFIKKENSGKKKTTREDTK